MPGKETRGPTAKLCRCIPKVAISLFYTNLADHLSGFHLQKRVGWLFPGHTEGTF